MAKYGLLIEYEYCFGCHSCEMSCKQEHNLPIDKWGIKVAEFGPMQIDEDRWSYNNVPIPTDLCDLCQERVKRGKQPACVSHCQAGVMKFGTLDELVKYMDTKTKVVLFVPRTPINL